jgi:hypothetical protein
VVTRQAQDVFKDRPDVEPQLGHSLSADLTRLLKAAWQSPRYDLVRGVATQTPVAPANRSARRNDES